MAVDTTHLCLSCMKERGRAHLCPFCGQTDIQTMDHDGQLPPRTILNQRYLLGLAMGQGDYGITYVAWDIQDEKRITVREFFPAGLAERYPGNPDVIVDEEGDPGLFAFGMEKVLEEARALARIQGEDGVIQVDDCFEAHGTVYMVAEFIEGISFQQYVGQKGGRLGLADACPVILKVADSLAKLNARGILHLRLNAEHIYITADDRVVVAGFGAAYHAIRERQASHSVQKRRKYGLEEKVRRVQSPGPWSDVYALGEVFYRAITGRAPQAYQERLEHDTLVSPSYLGVNIAEGVEQVIMRALALQIEDRYPDLGAFRQALQANADEPVPELPQEISSPPAEQRLDELIDRARSYVPDQIISGEEKSQSAAGEGAELELPSSRPIGPGRILAAAALVLLLLLAFSSRGYLTGFLESSGWFNGWLGLSGDKSGGPGDGQLTVDDDPMEIGIAGDWIYYVNNSDGTRLYRVKTDGTGRQRLNQDWSVDITVSGDWVYYVNNSDDMRLYRVRTDGSERQKLNDEYTLQILVSGDEVYYTSETDNLAMYRVKTDGSGRQKLFEGCSYCISVAGEWIYFNWINFQNVNDTGLYRIRLDGSDLQRIGAGLASYGIVVGDWVYYNNKSDGFKLYRLKVDGSATQKLGEDEAQDIALDNAWLYYINQSDGGRIYRIKLDGSERQKLGEDRSMHMLVAGDWVYYRLDSESGSLYRIRSSGSEPQLVVR